MRVLSDWRLRGLLGLTLVAGGLGWLASQHQPTHSSLSHLARFILPAVFSADKQSATRPSLLTDYGKTPLHFEPNVGQAHPDVKFLARGAGYSLMLLPDEAVFHLSRPQAGTRPDDPLPRMDHAVLRAQLVDASPQPRLQAQDKQASTSNYFLGNDPKQWHAGIANYGRVHFGQVWPGIDLVYYGNQQQLEYDFVVQPGVSPERIRLRYSGAERLHVERDGSLIAETRLGPVRQLPPVAYQDIGGIRHAVASHYVLAGNEVGFALGDYDQKRPLVIDPVLVYSSYLGGGSNFGIIGMAVTETGSAYVTGYTDNNNYPTVSPYQAARLASSNTVVSRFANNGRTLLWSTYLGGATAAGSPAIIAVDSDGNAWVAGTTKASDFPLSSATYQSTGNNLGAGFLSKLSADGQSLSYSTYLGGSTSIDGISGDAITGLAIAADGSAWVTGSAGSSNFPLANARQSSRPAGSNATGFITHFAADGLSLSYSSYLGGSAIDTPTRLVLAVGDIFVAGRTTSSDFPVTDGSLLNGTGTGTTSDVFVARLSADGQTLKQSRYLGGSNNEVPYGLAVDGSGNAFVAGSTQSTDFPTPAPGFFPADSPLANENNKTGNNDTAFLARYNNDGSKAFSIFLGQSGYASSVAITTTGMPVVGGRMTSTFTQVNPITNVSPTDAGNGFIRRLSADGQNLLFSAALGGSNSDEYVAALALDDADAIYVAGSTLSNDFPVKNAAYNYNSTFARSGFISKIASGPVITVNAYPNTTGINTDALLLWETSGADNCAWDDEGGAAAAFSGSRVVNESTLGNHDYTLRCSNSEGSTAETATLKIVPPPTASLSMSPASTIAVGQSVVLSWSSANATSCGLVVMDSDSVSASLVAESSSAIAGSITFPPYETGTLTFTLNCKGPGSNQYIQSTKTLTVVEEPVLTLTATPSRSPLFAGDTVRYVWTSAHTTSCEAIATESTADNDLLSGSQTLTGDITLTMPGSGTQSLTLKCTGATGADTRKTVSYTVYDASQPSIVSISAANASIKLYQSTKLSWSATNAQTCQASGAWTGSRAVTGSNYTVQPGSMGNHAYTLTCSRPNPDGSTSSFSATANVTVTTPDPPTMSLLATPTTVPVGSPFLLNWSSQNTDSCTASGWSDWNGSKQTSGAAQLTPAATGTLDLRLDCLGGSGVSVNKSVTITVIAAPVNPPDDNSGGDSGGPVDLLLLGGLGLLGLARRSLSR